MTEKEFVWKVVESEPFEAERDAAFLYLLKVAGPDYAGRWLQALLKEIASLPLFPGPRAHPLEEKASERFQSEVRRLLFYSPSSQRRRGTRYRILFSLSLSEDRENEGTIYLLRIRHGASADSGTQDT